MIATSQQEACCTEELKLGVKPRTWRLLIYFTGGLIIVHGARWSRWSKWSKSGESGERGARVEQEERRLDKWSKRDGASGASGASGVMNRIEWSSQERKGIMSPRCCNTTSLSRPKLSVK